MRILVVLVALAAFCHADDDSEEVTSHVVSTHAVDSHPLLKANIPATFPQVKTVPSSVMKVQTPIAHAMYSSPAVMKIPKPGVRFNIPVPQTQRFALPVEKTVPVPAAMPVPETVVMPKTVEAIYTMPTPVATLKSAAVPVPVNMHEFMPWSAMQSTGVPLPINTIVPATQFEQNIQAQGIPYYGSMIPNTFEVPASVFEASFAFPQQAAVVPSAIPVAEPIQYTIASDVAMPTVNMPFMASPFQMKAIQIPQAINYWRDFQTPQHMTNFMDLTTGGFSYANVIGGVSSVPMSQDTPMRVQHPFKAIQSQTSKVISPIMDVRVTPTAVEAQTSPVIAA